MKKHLNRLGACLLAASLGLAAAPALADDDCDVPVDRWQTRGAVHQWAARQGWDLQRVKIDDGCYEVRGEDAQGRAFKAKLDPETLKVMEIKYRDHGDRERRRDRDHDRDRERERARDQSSNATPGAAPVVPAGQASGPISVGGARIE
ncbi:PepSY domain-containing protein [uncultured Castellaniella sp.]|uniref:PepSY domain-containing protein n=1 Tax=uncultured Castellaniella sp. TaxID=647907 RepID=UPI0026336753|nr:PepSY domain-containing protein [uncultured Castellaniella sp.]